MTDPKAIREDIQQLYDRRDLVEDCFKAEAERVDNLIAQKAKWTLVEEARDKATFYFESYLDLTILIGRQAQKLGDTKKT